MSDLIKAVGSAKSDVRRALAVSRLLNSSAAWLSMVVFDGEPRTKAAAYREHHAPEAAALKKRLSQCFPKPVQGNIAVGCIFFRSDHHRVDSDNMMKQVLDSATGICWNDDCQVTAQLGLVEFDPDRPRTVILIGPHSSSMNRGIRTKNCAACGVEFVPAYFNRRYCSDECSGTRYGKLLQTVACAYCGQVFRRKRQAQRHCSSACQVAALATNKRAMAKPLPRCQSCGAELSRHGYAKCRACWRAGK